MPNEFSGIDYPFHVAIIWHILYSKQKDLESRNSHDNHIYDELLSSCNYTAGNDQVCNTINASNVKGCLKTSWILFLLLSKKLLKK